MSTLVMLETLEFMVVLLLDRGADKDAAGAPWATPLAWAEKRGHREIVETLKAW